MYDMAIRKKALKIQERLGMRLGIRDGTRAIPVVRTLKDLELILEDLYRVGLRAFVLPPDFFKGIDASHDIYKTHYGTLLKIKDLATKYGVELSLHHGAISEQPDEQLRTYSAVASIIEARLFTIHPNFYSRIMPPGQALTLAVHKINEIVTTLRMKVNLGIETTGRINEVGSLEDVIDIVKRTRSTEPVLNWAHIHARGAGVLRDQSDYRKTVSQVRAALGARWMQNAFFYFSGVSYGPSGETKHIPLDRSDLNMEHLIREIMAHEIKGTLIFEDPEREKFLVDRLEQLADMVR